MSEGQAGFEVREAQEEDREAIAALTLRAYRELAEVMAPTAWQGLDRAVRAGLENRDAGVRRFVAVREGRIVGSVMLYPPAADAYGGATDARGWPELRLLAVDPGERRGGVGQALVEACIRRAREDGATRLGLHTSRSLAAARRMYARMGFERAPGTDFQPEGAELVEGYLLSL